MSFGWLWYLSVIPALGFLVFVHELGHFLVGLRMGVKIEEFGFGYPPRMVTLFRYRGVPVTINWLPLGGFVRFAGEESNFDDPRSLASAPPRRKIPIMAAGAFMNIVTAILIFAFLAPFGFPESYGKVAVARVSADAPAAGVLQEGDKILKIEDRSITSSRDLLAAIKARQGKPTTLTIDRAGTIKEVSLTPRTPAQTPVGQGSVGIAPRVVDVEGIHYVEPIRNPFKALWYGVVQTFTLLRDMLAGLAMLVASLFGVGRSLQGGVGGPVAITRATGQIARTGGIWPLLNWTAMLSVNLGLINLLPIPALDGSRIVFALIESIRGKKVPPQREALVHAAGMMVLLGLMLLITFTDVSNWMHGHDVLGG
ncbi:MAG: M50 family metallopeptidase [Herpetosiphon sp.]